MKQPKPNLKQEQEDLLHVLEENTDTEVQEAIQTALAAMRKPTKPAISYSTEGAADANPQ